MPPASKRFKPSETPASPSVSDELQSLQNEISKIKGTSDAKSDAVEDSDNVDSSKVEESYLLVEETVVGNKSQLCSENQFEDLKKFIRDQIRLSERRVQNRCDIIEGKLNRLLERQAAQSGEEEEFFEEEHLFEVIEEGSQLPKIYQPVEVSEADCRIFPITDETSFDWFFDNLKSEEYRNSLIQRRWNLTRAVNMKSLRISVKDFLLMHFDLAICIKYSVSGFGAHGSRKRKLDSNSLTIFVFGCFSRSNPGVHSFSDISKAIVQFWGRTPEYFNRATERAVKQELTQ